MKHFYLSKWKNVQIGAYFLFLLNTGCCNLAERPDAVISLSADAADNGYLRHILYSRNSNSIAACADADFKAGKYYLFTTNMPGDEKFSQYLAVYAKQRYHIILVNCGWQSHLGACCYNNAMAVALKKIKPFDAIYLEAKGRFNKLLL